MRFDDDSAIDETRSELLARSALPVPDDESQPATTTSKAASETTVKALPRPLERRGLFMRTRAASRE
jgi:hypothetical protein